MNGSTYKRELLAIVLVLIPFLLASYLSQKYVEELTQLFGVHDTLGMLLYVSLATLATIIAPLSFLPLLPVAVALWGSLATAFLSIIAWTLGAAVAFLLARHFGRPLIQRLVGEKRMMIFEKLIPQKYLFLAIVILRICLPVDLLSYALGLFGVISFFPYMLATILGIVPFAFFFSYIVQVPIWYQILLFTFGILFAGSSYPYLRKRYELLFLSTETQEYGEY